MTLRLNARIDEELAAKLDYLRRQTDKSTTEILRESIQLYYDRFKAGTESCASALERIGFIGCGEAEPELSTEYKQILRKSLSGKVG